MAPTTSPFPAPSQSPLANGHFHRVRRQASSFLLHPPGQSSWVSRQLDTAIQPPVTPEGPPFTSAPSEPVALSPEPSAFPVNNQLQGPSQSEDIPGTIVAAIVVVILILGGLIGLLAGGAMLRRRTRAPEQVSSQPSKRSGCQESNSVQKETGSPHVKRSHERFQYEEKALTSLVRPPPALDKERRRRLADIWPIRSLSRVLCNRGSHQEHAERRCSVPHAANPQTTWSEFTPVTLYVPPPRTVLDRIPEELDSNENQTNSESGSAVRRSATKQVTSATAERCSLQDFQTMDNAATNNEDDKSLGSSTPDMTSDGGESSRSSMASLESLVEDKSDHESIREEVFELKRAQTTSMQMNKGVLLSLGFNSILNDSQTFESADGKLGVCGPSRSSHTPDVVEANYVERELSLAILGGSFSAVDLDEFPSPPSILPVIPSFVSGF